jgi:tripartite-type tricarboxylate transporter receptor subunit TctC
MVHSASHIANAFMYKNLPYDTLQDFAGITALARQVAVLVVHPSLPARSVAEFIELARKRPGDVAYATAGNGSMQHLTMALINSMTGTKMLHVPYKGGGPANIALMAGETHATITTIGSVIPHLNSKRVRPLGVTSETRLPQFPDLPAIAEAIPGYEFTAWIGAFAPAATPAAIVERLNAELRKALEHPETSKHLVSQALDPMYLTPAEFAMRLRADYEKYGKLIRATVKAE